MRRIFRYETPSLVVIVVTSVNVGKRKQKDEIENSESKKHEGEREGLIDRSQPLRFFQINSLQSANNDSNKRETRRTKLKS